MAIPLPNCTINLIKNLETLKVLKNLSNLLLSDSKKKILRWQDEEIKLSISTHISVSNLIPVFLITRFISYQTSYNVETKLFPLS